MTHAIWAKQNLARYPRSVAEVVVDAAHNVSVIVRGSDIKDSDVITFPKSNDPVDLETLRAVIRGHNRRATRLKRESDEALAALATAFEKS